MSQPPSLAPDGSSPPLSRSGQYRATCAGRVKPYLLMSCTELE